GVSLYLQSGSSTFSNQTHQSCSKFTKCGGFPTLRAHTSHTQDKSQAKEFCIFCVQSKMMFPLILTTTVYN
uniref:Uncharacterized protein n=1 Tax=Ciona savignyi TaxID=51511 RepID=H2YWC0_CIOSA